MPSLTVVGGCVLVNDILESRNGYVSGGGKSNPKFKDLGVPLLGVPGLRLSTNQNNRVTKSNTNKPNETQYIDQELFDNLVKKIT